MVEKAAPYPMFQRLVALDSNYDKYEMLVFRCVLFPSHHNNHEHECRHSITRDSLHRISGMSSNQAAKQTAHHMPESSKTVGKHSLRMTGSMQRTTYQSASMSMKGDTCSDLGTRYNVGSNTNVMRSPHGVLVTCNRARHAQHLQNQPTHTSCHSQC